MAITTVTSIPYYSAEHADAVTVVTAFGQSTEELQVSLEDLLTWSRGNYDSLKEHVDGDIALTPRTNGAESQTAWDMRYAASKDHSVLWGLAPDELAPAIKEAHVLGVRAALEYMASYAVVARVQSKGLRYARHIDPLMVAVEHSTNRFDYPHLHTHALIFRDGLDPNDKKLRALTSPWLYRHFAASRAVQRAVSRYELSQLLPGLQFALDPDGDTAELRITAIQRRFRNLFSSRQHVLRAAAKALGGSPVQMASLKEHNMAAYHGQIQRSVYDTRPNKGAIPTPSDELRQYWLSMAEEQGFDPTIYDQWSDGRTGTHSSAKEHVGLPVMLQSVFDQVRAELTVKQGTWTKETLIVALCNAMPQGIPSVAAVMQLAEQFLASHSIQLVPTDLAGNAITAAVHSVSPAQLRPTDEVDSYHLSRLRSRFATPETISYEHAFANWVRVADGSSTQLSSSHVEAELANYQSLSDEQIQAVKTITQSPKGAILVRGGPGSGKTFMLRVAATAWRQSGVEVYGVAKTGRAATELQMAVPNSYTIDSFLFLMSQSTPPERFVVLCDEASMASTKELHDLAQYVFAHGGRLCLVGDHRQLPSIDAGGLFTHLWLHQERTEDTIADGMVEMHGNQRQVTDQLRYVVQAIEQNDPASAIASLVENDQWTTGADETQLMHDMVLRWMKESSVGISDMLAYRRDDVTRLNMLAREMLLDRSILGSLGETDPAGTAVQPTLPQLGRIIMRLPASKKSTEAGVREYRIGERIMCLKNQSFKYPQPYYVKGREGRWTKVRNSWSGTIISATTADVTVHFDHGETITLPYSYVRDFTTYGYAKTIYRAQGITVGNRTTKGTALIYRPEILDAQSAWVALTRATHNVHLYELMSPDHVEHLLDDHNSADFERIASDADDPQLKYFDQTGQEDDKTDAVIVLHDTAPTTEEESKLTIESEIVPDLSSTVEHAKGTVGDPWTRVSTKWKIRYKPETTLDIDFIMGMARDAALKRTDYELRAWVNSLSSIEKLYDNAVVPSYGTDDTPKPAAEMFISAMVEAILFSATQGGTYSDISMVLEAWLLKIGTGHGFQSDTDFLKLQDLLILFKNPVLDEAYRHFVAEGKAMSGDPFNPMLSPFLVDHVRHQVHQRLKDRMHRESTLPAQIDELRLVANVASEYRAEILQIERTDSSGYAALLSADPESAVAFVESKRRAAEQSELLIQQAVTIATIRDPEPEPEPALDLPDSDAVLKQIELWQAQEAEQYYESLQHIESEERLNTPPPVEAEERHITSNPSEQVLEAAAPPSSAESEVSATDLSNAAPTPLIKQTRQEEVSPIPTPDQEPIVSSDAAQTVDQGEVSRSHSGSDDEPELESDGFTSSPSVEPTTPESDDPWGGMTF